MGAGVTREEFDALADQIAGEKTIKRHILEQTRRNGDDLAALKTRVGRVEEKVDNLDRKVDGLHRKLDGLERKVDGVDRKVDGLMRDLPRIVGDTMREVLRERDVNK